ncbi:MAG: Uncharacterized protein G01um101433_153 [Parcubacteria group bacterium Gr01-1014_33]|nr:MAG: Uncharacterized protein G01um101433_153 [Parcubacteria group bacterium Gr01-1014_33]
MLAAIFFLLTLAYWKYPQGAKKTRLSYFAVGIIALLLFRAVVLSILLYGAWKRNVPGKFLLPPYQPLGYFLGYAFTHFFASFVLSLASALVCAAVLKSFARTRENMFRPGEISLFISCAMLIRWPLMIPYTAAIFFSSALRAVSKTIILQRDARVIMGPMMLANAVPFVFFGTWILRLPIFQLLAMPL